MNNVIIFMYYISYRIFFFNNRVTSKKLIQFCQNLDFKDSYFTITGHFTTDCWQFFRIF